jgi:hypothetical protein
MYAEDKETLDRPNLDQPGLRTSNSTVAPTVFLGTVHVPAGFRIRRTNPRRGQARTVSLPAQDLHRAAAQLELCRLLARRWPPGSGDPDWAAATKQLLNAQEQFAWYCRQAELGLALPGRLVTEIGPPKRPLADWLARLRLENQKVMQPKSLTTIRLRAEEGARSGIHRPGAARTPPDDRHGAVPDIDLPQTGTPFYWQADSARNSPQFALAAATESHHRKALAGTALLLIGFLAAWILSYFPTLLRLVQKAWPEQLLLLGWAAWQVFDLPLAAILFVALGLAARLYLLGRWGIGLLHRAAVIVASPESGTSST